MFDVLRENNYQSSILYPGELSVKKHGKINFFPGKRKFRVNQYRVLFTERGFKDVLQTNKFI